MDYRFEDILEEYRRRVAQGSPLEEVIAELRVRGLNLFDATRAIRRLYPLSLRDAQFAVLQYPVWAEQAKNVIFLEDVVKMFETDPAYYTWTDWYYGGIPHEQMVLVASSQREDILAHVHQLADENEHQQASLDELARGIDDTFDALVEIVARNKKYEPSVVELALQVLHAIGYPRIASALRWLVNLAVDAQAPGREQAIEILRAVNDEAIIPYFLAALVNTHEKSPRWSQVVSGVCEIVLHKPEWLRACGPAVATLLAQDEQQHPLPDPAPLFKVLESLIPTCTYVIPVLYQWAMSKKGRAIGEQAHRLLLRFPEEDVNYYRYHLKWLKEK